MFPKFGTLFDCRIKKPKFNVVGKNRKNDERCNKMVFLKLAWLELLEFGKSIKSGAQLVIDTITVFTPKIVPSI